MKILGFLFIAFISFNNWAQEPQKQLPDGFVYVTDYIEHISVDLKYCHHDNFVGTPIRGYNYPKVILTKRATIALHQAEQELNKQGLGFKIFDAYRPQQAVSHFKSWAEQINDTLTKKAFYPDIDKSTLFQRGFIASKSGHSRGSTIDLTIIHLKSGKELDMGSPFDFFGPISAHNYTKLTSAQKNNRLLLKKTMEKHGFKAYNKEWWHYTLIHEPFPKTYYDFTIE